jgi:hypothetical protein
MNLNNIFKTFLQKVRICNFIHNTPGFFFGYRRKKVGIADASFKILFFLISISIYSTPIVEKIDKTDFPKIQIQIREDINKPIQNQSISIRETLNNLTKDIVVVDVIKKNSSRPIKVIFVVQASSIQENTLSREIASSLLNKLGSDDKLSLFVYSNEEMVYLEDLDQTTFKEKISSIPEGKINKLFYNISNLFNKIKVETIPTFLVIISHNRSSDSYDPNSKLFENASNMHIRFHVVTNDTTSGNILSSQSGGIYYPFEDKLLVDKLTKHLTYLKRKPTTLEYTSSFEESIKELETQNINVELIIDDFQYELDYNIGIFNFIGYKFQDVEFVFSILISILLLCTIFLFSMMKNKERTREAYIQQRKANKYKADLYYHENNAFHEGNKVAVLTTSSYSDDDDLRFDDSRVSQSFRSSIDTELIPQTSRDLPKGKKYSTAFFIQKEGPNPGRQFNITMDEVEIGSDASNDLILKDTTISLKHAKIKKTNDVFYIYDLVSQRGTYVNGKKILKPKPLSDFDEIRLGRTLLLFRGK